MTWKLNPYSTNAAREVACRLRDTINALVTISIGNSGYMRLTDAVNGTQCLLNERIEAKLGFVAGIATRGGQEAGS
jgi:hypothetical protein